MIKSIYIKDFAIIDELRIDFDKGLSVFIGETGAGKSIIVGAISFLSGERADMQSIRKGASKAIIEGVFSISDDMANKLKDYDIEFDDEVIIYRTISSDGRNTIRVNNRTVTLSFLNNLLNNEIDIHSQKDSQYLLKEQNHLKLLDLYLNRNDVLDNLKEKYRVLNKLKNEYNEYLSNNDSDTDIEYFKYQINEIEEAKLDIDEEEELLIFEKRYKSYQKMIDHLSKAIELYEGENGINDRLYELIKELNIDDDEITKIQDKINNNYYELEESINSLKAILKDIDISESQINANQERLFEINRLKRKYKGDISDILKLKEDLIKRVDLFDNRQKVIEDYENNINKAHKDYIDIAKELHDLRQEAAIKLEKDIILEMDGLELKYFDFKVDINKGDESSKGYDDVAFLISTNKGEDLKPLIRVASGGEMSRILLGLKAIFTSISDISLAIFDEIDTGVSGKAALAIGKKMAKISKKSQVLSITHLAQVAAFKDNLYFVSKLEKEDRTSSSIKLLEDEEAISELAMMANSKISESTLNSAKDLLLEAKMIKEEL